MKKIIAAVFLTVFISGSVFAQGSPPVPTSKYVKAKMFANVRDFGASGDSSQNALPYLKAAKNWLAQQLDAGEQGILYVPRGTYRLVDSAFNIDSSGIIMVCQGARFVATDTLYGGQVLGIIGSQSNVLKNVGIIGAEIIDYTPDTAKNNGIGCVWAQGPIIRDNVIRRASRKGISTHYVSNAWIENNHIDTAGFAGIVIEWGSQDSGLYRNIWVQNNYIGLVDTTLGSPHGAGDLYAWVGIGNGIAVTSHDTTAATGTGRTLENVIIGHNIIGTVPNKPIAWLNYTSQREPTGIEYGNIVLDSARYGKFASQFDIGKSGQIRLYQTDTTGSAAATRGFVTTRDGNYTVADLLGLHMFSSGTSNLNVVELGGGFSSYQAADYVRLMTADGHGDTEGSQRLRADSTQVHIYGVPLRLDSSLYMDYNNNQAQQYIYFSDEGGVGQAWLRYDTTADLFTSSHGFVVNGNGLYIGGSANQQYNYLYFPDEAGSGQAWLRFDTTNEAFMIPLGTNMYKGGAGNALVADSQFVTKNYADNAAAGLVDSSVTSAKLATAVHDLFLKNAAWQDSLAAAVLNADTLDAFPVALTGLTNREVLSYNNSTGNIVADSVALTDIKIGLASTGQVVVAAGGVWQFTTIGVRDSSNLLDGYLKNVSDTMMWVDGTDTARFYFNASSEFIIDGPGSGPSYADSSGAVDTANTTFQAYVTNHAVAGSGSEDSVYFNEGSTEYSSVDNLLKVKEGAGIDITREDSTAYDVIRIAATLGTAIAGSEITDQTIQGDDIDSTAENFVFTNAFKGTSAVADSVLITREELEDSITVVRGHLADTIEAVTGDVTVSSGVSAITAQSIVGDDIDSTSENFVFNNAFKVTSAVPDSVLITREELEDSITAWRANFNDSLSAERVFDIVKAFFESNVENGGAITPDDADNTIDFIGDTTTGIIADAFALRATKVEIRDTIKAVLQQRSLTIMDPDQLGMDSIMIFPVEAEAFPNGITLVDIGIKTWAATSYSVAFVEFSEPGAGGTESAIETVATSSSREAEDDGTLTDASMAAGSIIVAVLPATDIAQLTIWFTFTVN